MSFEEVATLTRFMRSQLVTRFKIDSLEVEFSPQALYPAELEALDPDVAPFSDDEREEIFKDEAPANDTEREED